MEEQTYFDDLSVNIHDFTEPVRDPNGFFFEKGTILGGNDSRFGSVSLGRGDGEYAYQFLAAINGVAKQMAKEGRSNFHVSMDVKYRDAVIKNLELDLGSPQFSGEATVSEALLKYANHPDTSIPNPLTPADIHTFETLKLEEQAYADDYEKGDAIRDILDGKPPVYPYMKDCMDDFLFHAYHSKEGQKAIVQAWNTLHPLPDEDFIATTKEERKKLFFDFPNLQDILKDKHPCVWMDENGAPRFGTIKQAATLHPSTTELENAVLKQKLPENDTLMASFQEKCSDESIICQHAAETVQKYAKAHETKLLRNCAETLRYDDIHRLKNRVLSRISRPDQLNDLKDVVDRVVSRKHNATGYDPQIDHFAPPERTSRGEELVAYWKKHPKEIESSVHKVLSQNTEERRNILSVVAEEAPRAHHR